MARYIDADKLIEELKLLEMFITGMLCGKTLITEAVAEYKKSALRLIDEQPTADVAPKSEVEQLRLENQILSQNADTAFQDGLNEAQDLYAEQIRSEVAREIFMDIDRVVEKYSMGDIEYPAFINIIAELKKKYGVTDTNVGGKYTEEKE